ncbi:MAG TPA: UGSC family (seleno)protein, partial [Methylomirabilota bacterium]|nr:UGSC family (seleno)protein [Methylomirabilota bacterium]
MTEVAEAALTLPEEDVYAEFCKREWCDGLPFVPPTAERVHAMVGGARTKPAESLGVMPPLWRECSVEKLAVNAVMAGCEPAYFPVIVAAVQAMLDPAFNLYGVQATTHPVAPLVIVHGPAATRLGMHAGAGVFGPGNAANATLGRAVRLCLWNLGGARPGAGDMATQGSPAK